jgi:hypothetical protein
MNELNENKQKSAKEKKEEEILMEKLEILQKSREVGGKQLTFDMDSMEFKEIDEVKELLQKSIETPEERYSMFYNGIQNVLIKYLPKHKGFQPYRQIIYDEKNIFLNRGKMKDATGKRGTDSRMAYNEDYSEIVLLVSNWAMTTQDPIDLYRQLWDLNEKYNYPHQEYDKGSKSFQNAMKKLANIENEVEE